MYNPTYKILILEDNVNDVDLLERELIKSGLSFNFKVLQTRVEFEKELNNFSPDIILSDYNLPSFTGTEAFQIKQKICPETPFIIVSGAIGEEFAVEIIKNGITDYVLKDKLYSLISKIKRALIEAQESKQKRIADEKLIQSEQRIRNFAKHLNQAIEDERAHIAREMHDEIGQQLAGIKMALLNCKGPNYDSLKNDDRVNKIIDDVDNTLQSVRKIATQLRPGILDSIGLIPSIEWLVKEFEKNTTIKFHLALNKKSCCKIYLTESKIVKTFFLS